MANNVTVTPAAAKMVYASGSTDFITVSGNVSGSSSPNYGVGGLHITSDQTDSFGVFIHNKKAGGGNQYAKLELASEDDNLMVYHTWDNSAGGLGAQRFTQTIGETRAIFQGRSATNQLVLISGGNVGMGTQSPNATLDVYDTTTQQRWSYDGSYYADMTVESDGDTTLYARQGALNLKAPGTKTIRLDSSGDIMADLGGSSGTYLFKVVDSSVNWLFTVHDDGLAGLHGSDSALEIKERASAPNHTAAYGKLWVKNDDPANLYYTDDGGNDIALTNNGSAAGGGGTFAGSLSDNYIPIGTAADTIGNFVLGLTENNSIWIGSDPSSTTSTAEYNTAVGITALDAITTGDKNVAIGYDALSASTTAHSNIAIGYQALDSVTAGSENVAIGTLAGQAYVGGNSTTGGFGVFIGHTAGYLLTGNGSYKSITLVGHAAGYSATGAQLSTGIGASALYYADGALNTTAVGRLAGAYDEGTGSVWVGDSAGYRISGNYNVALGYAAMSGASSGTGYGTAQKNVAIGRDSLTNITSGYNNVGIGYDALNDITTGYDNTVVGMEAAATLTTGYYNTYIGKQAGSGATTAAHSNVGIGLSALSSAHGAGNVAIGRGALGNTTDANQVAIGYSALESNTSGEKNTAIGFQALQANTTGNYNTAIGHEALEANVHGYGNVAIGYHALATAAPADTTGYNVAIGYEALYDLTDGVYNTAIGWAAGNNITTGDNSVIIGNNAGQAMTTQNENVLVGQVAGQDLTGQYNTFIGSAAGYNATSADANVAIGRQAMGAGVATGDYNVVVGYAAGHNFTSAHSNTIVGLQAGQYLTGGDKNTLMGYLAGRSLTTGDGNVFIGYEAGNNTDHDTESNKLVIANSNTTTPLIDGDFTAASVTINGDLSSHNLAPVADDTYTLGTPAKQWQELHISDIIYNKGYIHMADSTGLAGTNRIYASGANLYWNTQKLNDQSSTAVETGSNWTGGSGGVFPITFVEDAAGRLLNTVSAATLAYFNYDVSNAKMTVRNADISSDLTVSTNFILGGVTVTDIKKGTDSASTSDSDLVTAGYVNAHAGGGGSIGGSITNDQVAFGASTSNSIEGTANFTYDGSEKLTLGTNGGLVLESTNNNAPMWIRNGGTNGGSIQFGAGSTLSNGNTKMHIKDDGKVGIGTTSPTQTLDVRGTTFLSGATDTVPFEVFAYGAGTSAMHVTSGSYTGLGTATPLAKLHINASAYQMVFQRDTHHHTIVKGNSDDSLTFATGAPGSHTARFKILPTGVDVVNALTVTGTATLGDGSTLATSAAPTADAQIANKKYVDDNAGGAITASANGANNRIAIYTAATALEGDASLTFDGTDLINTAGTLNGSSGACFEVIDVGQVTGDVNNVSRVGPIMVFATLPSDSRLKTNRSVFGYGLNEIKQLTPEYFNYSESAYKDTTLSKPDFTKKQIGLMADDVKAVMPELVETIPDTDYETYDKQGLVNVLINAVKELSDKNDALEARLAALEE